MQLLTKGVQEKFKQMGRQEDSKDPIVIAKFFNPAGGQTWLATEYDEREKLFFGYVSLFNDYNNEWGYFSLEELEAIKVMPFGLRIERDRFFTPAPLSEVKRREGIN